MSRRAASLLLAQLVHKPNSILGLATGSTPLGLYKELIEAYSRGETDFSSVTSFNLDEYLGIPNTDPNSYFSFMQEQFQLRGFSSHIWAYRGLFGLYDLQTKKWNQESIQALTNF